MKQRILSIFCALAMCLSLLPAAALAAEPEGNWSDMVSAKPAGYTVDDSGNVSISSSEGLAWLAVLVNKYSQDFSGKTVTLTEDIDLSAHYWTPIGTSSNDFRGTFDGENHTITGLTIVSGTTYAGLFGYIYGGTVKNVWLAECSITRTSIYTAGICGLNSSGTIENCHVLSGSISGGQYTAGICGQCSSKATVTGCSNAAGVTSSSNYVGGICGYVSTNSNDGGVSISGCVNTGAVTAEKCKYVGGICGRFGSQNVSISDCLNTGAVSGKSYVGGICGYSYDKTELEYCLNTGAVSGTGSSIDPFCPAGSGTADNCYSVDSSTYDGCTEVTQAQLNSGEAAWLLQGGREGTIWGQLLSSDAVPQPDDGNRVVKITVVNKTAGEETELPAFYANAGKPATNYPDGYEYFEDEACQTAIDTGTMTYSADAKIYAKKLAPAAVKVAPEAKTDLIYNGEGQELVTAGEAENGTMMYSLNGEEYSAGIPKGKDAGTYTVWYKAVGTNGGSVPASIKATIEKKEITAAVTGSVTKEYDGNTAVPTGHSLSISLIGVIEADKNEVVADTTNVNYAYKDVSAGQNKTVTACDVTLSGDRAFNYRLTGEVKGDVGTITKIQITDLTAPADQTLTMYCTSADEVIAKLPTTVSGTTAKGNVDVDITCSFNGTYNPAPGAENSFTWTATAPENYAFASGVGTTGTITVTNKSAASVTITTHEKAVTYNGQTIDVSTIGLFTIDVNAGAPTYSIEAGGTGEGQLDGTTFTVTKAGTFRIKVTTAAVGNYAAGEAAATLTVNKANRTVTAPTAASVSTTSVTLNAVTVTGDGRVEYAKSESDSEPTDGWQQSTVFDNLIPDTTYYFFARVTGGDNYEDATSDGTGITTESAAPAPEHCVLDASGALVGTYPTLAEAFSAAMENGCTVELGFKDELKEAIPAGVTLRVPDEMTLTVNNAGDLATGTLEIRAGGELLLGTEKLVGSTDGALKLTEGSVTMSGGTVTLTSDSTAEIPSGQTLYLMLGSSPSPALNAVIEEGAALTVNGTLKAVSGSSGSGSRVKVSGTLDVLGTMTVAQKAQVEVVNGGELKLKQLSVADIIGTGDGTGIKGDLVFHAGAKLTYGGNPIIGYGNDPVTLDSGKAALNLSSTGASLTVNDDVAVSGSVNVYMGVDAMRAPIHITLASGTATIESGATMNLAGSSLTIQNGAGLDIQGTLEVQSKASFSGAAAVSGAVYVFEETGGSNPAGGATFTLSGSGKVYAQTTELSGTAIQSAKMETGSYPYTSIGGTTQTVFTHRWRISGTYGVTYDLTHITAENQPASVTEGGTLSTTLTAAPGFELPDRITVTMGGTTLTTGCTYDKSSGNVTISNVLGDIVITAEGVAKEPAATAPTITSQPSSVSVQAGQTAAFSVTATGNAPLAYQWQVRKGVGSTWDNIPGASSASYITEATTPAMNGWQYRCVVSNSAGSAASSAATLTVTRDAVVLPDTHAVTVAPTEHGSVSVTPGNSSAGGKITVTVRPDEGCSLSSLTVTDAHGNKLHLSGEGGVYTFTMPDSDVTVTAVFSAGADACDRGAACPLRAFNDLDVFAWYHDGIHCCLENGLMEGVDSALFAPDAPVTRAMAWAILARIDGVTVTGADWAETARAWAAAEGVSDGTDPMGAVTREQLVTMLWRFKGEPAVDFLLTAKDAGTVSGWAYEAMRWAVAEGIIEGDENGLITPTAAAARAQAAAIFMRFIAG